MTPHRFDDGRCAHPVHFRRERLPRANSVNVGIDEARNYGASLQIDHARVRTRLPSNFGIAANGREFAVSHGNGFANRELRIHR